MFTKLKAELCPKVTGFVLCPIRWTVYAATMESVILINFMQYFKHLDEAKAGAQDSETHARIGGVETAMSSYYLFLWFDP